MTASEEIADVMVSCAAVPRGGGSRPIAVICQPAIQQWTQRRNRDAYLHCSRDVRTHRPLTDSEPKRYRDNDSRERVETAEIKV